MNEFDFLHLISLSPTFFLSFLGTKEVLAIDNACVNGNVRKRFLSCLQGTTLSQLVCSGRSMDWILRRKVKPEVLFLDRFMTEIDVILLSEVTSAVQVIDIDRAVDRTIRHSLHRILVRFCPQLRKIVVNPFAAFTVDVLLLASSCPVLTELSINQARLKFADFKTILQKFRHITVLDVGRCATLTEGRALEYVAELCPQLTTLHIDNTARISQGVFHLIATRLPALAHLHIDEFVFYVHTIGVLNPVVPVGFRDFVQNCPPLQSLHLKGVLMPIADVLELLNRSPHLRNLSLQYFACGGAENDWFDRAVTGLPKLQTLVLVHASTFVSSSTVQAVAEHCTQMRAITLQHSGTLDSDALGLLATHCTALRKLWVTSLAPNVFPAIALQCNNLEELDLGATTITQEDLNYVAAHCLKLTHFSFHSQTVELDFCIVAPFMRNLQHFRTGCTCSDASVLSLVTHCRQLRSLRLLSKRGKCSDVRIVDAIERYCPHLSLFEMLRLCSRVLYNGLVRLQAQRATQKVHFQFITLSQPTCCGLPFF